MTNVDKITNEELEKLGKDFQKIIARSKKIGDYTKEETRMIGLLADYAKNHSIEPHYNALIKEIGSHERTSEFEIKPHINQNKVSIGIETKLYGVRVGKEIIGIKRNGARIEDKNDFYVFTSNGKTDTTTLRNYFG